MQRIKNGGHWHVKRKIRPARNDWPSASLHCCLPFAKERLRVGKKETLSSATLVSAALYEAVF